MLSIQRSFLFLPWLLAIATYVLVALFRRSRFIAKWHAPVDILFLSYLFVVVGALFFPLGINTTGEWMPDLHVNLVPVVNTLKSYEVSIRVGMLDWIVPLLLGNLLIFVPLSFYLAFRFPGKERRSFAIVLAVSVGAEILQFLLIFVTRVDRRVTDIDDLILNAIGGIGGWLLARSILRGVERRRSRRRRLRRNVSHSQY